MLRDTGRKTIERDAGASPAGSPCTAVWACLDRHEKGLALRAASHLGSPHPA